MRNIIELALLPVFLFSLSAFPNEVDNRPMMAPFKTIHLGNENVTFYSGANPNHPSFGLLVYATYDDGVKQRALHLRSPQTVSWLALHSFYSSVQTSTSIAFGVYAGVAASAIGRRRDPQAGLMFARDRYGLFKLSLLPLVFQSLPYLFEGNAINKCLGENGDCKATPRALFEDASRAVEMEKYMYEGNVFQTFFTMIDPLTILAVIAGSLVVAKVIGDR